MTLLICLLTPKRCAYGVILVVNFFVASSMQTHESAKPGHEFGHYHLGRLRRLRVVVEGRHSPGSHLLRHDLTVAPPQLLLYLTSSAGSQIQSLIWMSSMMSQQNSYTLDVTGLWKSRNTFDWTMDLAVTE